MIRPMDVTPEVIDALDAIRTWVSLDTDRPYLRHALRTLEETGVFAEIDEAIDSDTVLGLLVEGASIETGYTLSELHNLQTGP